MKNKNSKTRNTIYNLIVGFGYRILVPILSFVVRTFFIEYLGKEYLGLNGVFSGIFQMLSLTELGFGVAMGFRFYKPIAENNDKRVRVLLKFYKQVYRIIGFVIIGIGLLLIPLFPVLIKDYDNLAVLGVNTILIFGLHLATSALSYWFFAYRSVILSTDEKEYIINIINAISQLVLAIIQIVVLIVFKSYVIYLSMQLLKNILTNIAIAVITKRMYPSFFEKEKDSLSKAEIKELFKDCGATFLYKTNNVIIKSTDNLVLSSFLGLAATGIYSNYFVIYTTISGILVTIYSSCRASLGMTFVSATDKEKYFFFKIVYFITIMLFGTACVGVSVVGNELMLNWLGKEFVVGQPLAILIGIELLFYGLKYNLGQIRNITGIFQQLWYRPLIGCIVNLIVSIILVQYIGMCGVILGTIISDICSNFLLEPKAIYKYSFNNYKSVSRYYVRISLDLIILIIVGIIDFYICKNVLVGYGVISLIAHALICGISVPIVFCIIYSQTEEFKYLLSKMTQLIHGKRR